MEKVLTITRCGYEDGKLFETSARIEEELFKQINNTYCDFLYNILKTTQKLSNITWIFWEMFVIDKDSDINSKELEKRILKYFNKEK